MARRKSYPDNILSAVKVDGATVGDLDFSCLTERENAVIQMYYIENKMTQKAIADIYGVTPQHMSRIIAKAVRKIRRCTRRKLNQKI